MEKDPPSAGGGSTISTPVGSKQGARTFTRQPPCVLTRLVMIRRMIFHLKFPI